MNPNHKRPKPILMKDGDAEDVARKKQRLVYVFRNGRSGFIGSVRVNQRVVATLRRFQND